MAAMQRLIAGWSTLLYLHDGVVGETVTNVSPRLLAQQNGLPGLFHIALGEQSKVRKLGDVGQALCTVGARAEKPGATVAEPGPAGWARGEAA